MPLVSRKVINKDIYGVYDLELASWHNKRLYVRVRLGSMDFRNEFIVKRPDGTKRSYYDIDEAKDAYNDINQTS